MIVYFTLRYSLIKFFNKKHCMISVNLGKNINPSKCKIYFGKNIN